MSRRRRAVKREIEADPVYKSVLLSKFINKVMIGGAKSTARRIVYNALSSFAQTIQSDNPLKSFEQALENAKPMLEVKSKRIGGATYQVPIEIPADRRISMAMKWIIMHAQKKVGKSMERGLSHELTECYHNQGATIKKKDDTHKMADANKAFAHLGHAKPASRG